MFSNVYQKGQTGVEVLLASGKNPGTNWEISTSVHRVYDRTVKGFVFFVEKPSTASMLIPISTKKVNLGLTQRYLVLQMRGMANKPITLEVCTLDTNSQRHRFHFSSKFKTVETKSLHAQIPFPLLQEHTWFHVILDLYSLSDVHFRAIYVGIDSICIRPSCRIRKVFTLPSVDVLNGEVFNCPDLFEFPVGTVCDYRLFTGEEDSNPSRGVEDPDESSGKLANPISRKAAGVDDAGLPPTHPPSSHSSSITLVTPLAALIGDASSSRGHIDDRKTLTSPAASAIGEDDKLCPPANRPTGITHSTTRGHSVDVDTGAAARADMDALAVHEVPSLQNVKRVAADLLRGVNRRKSRASHSSAAAASHTAAVPPGASTTEKDADDAEPAGWSSPGSDSSRPLSASHSTSAVKDRVRTPSNADVVNDKGQYSPGRYIHNDKDDARQKSPHVYNTLQEETTSQVSPLPRPGSSRRREDTQANPSIRSPLSTGSGSNPWMVGLGSPLSMHRSGGGMGTVEERSAGAEMRASSPPTTADRESFGIHQSDMEDGDGMCNMGDDDDIDGRNGSFVEEVAVPTRDGVSVAGISHEDIIFLRPAIAEHTPSHVETSRESLLSPARKGLNKGKCNDGNSSAGTYCGLADTSGSRESSESRDLSARKLMKIRSYLVDMEKSFVEEYGKTEYEYIMRK